MIAAPIADQNPLLLKRAKGLNVWNKAELADPKAMAEKVPKTLYPISPAIIGIQKAKELMIIF